MLGLHNKIYYNVIINGTPDKNNYYVPAKFRVNLNQSVLKNASDYSAIVQKFKIDSESIPLFHVELLQPQIKLSEILVSLLNITYTSVIMELFTLNP